MNSYLKGHDLFGQYVNVSYQGMTTFTTGFGGAVSVMIKLFMLVYVSNEIKNMWLKSQWELSQQTISATKEAMQVLHTLKDVQYQNVSVAI